MELTNEEKISIVNQHKRNLELNKYNIQLSIIEENAIANPNLDSIASLNLQISDLNSKITALDNEIVSLS